MAKNVRALIHELGGQAAVQRELDAKGHEISLSGIEQMCIRNSVAGKWIPRLQKIADAQANGVQVTDYLHDEEESQ